MLPKPGIEDVPCCYIVNTDRHNKPGRHWVSFFFPASGCPEYFDSFGMVPMLPEFYKFMGERHFLYNNIPLQEPLSTTCGQYCLFYLLARIHGYTFEHFISLFDINLPQLNDEFVNDFITSTFDVELKIYDYDFIDKQISLAYVPDEEYATGT